MKKNCCDCFKRPTPTKDNSKQQKNDRRTRIDDNFRNSKPLAIRSR